MHLRTPLQGYRAQKQREMGECVAYAQSLRGKDGQVLTPKVAHVFQDAVEDRRSAKERDKDKGGASRGAEGSSDVERSLKNVLREAVGKEHPEFSSSSGGSSYDSELSTGDDEDDGSRGSDFSWSSGDAERGTIDSTSSTSSTTRRKRRRRKAGTTDRSGGSSGFSTPISSSGQEESHEERRKGDERRIWVALVPAGTKSGSSFRPTNCQVKRVLCKRSCALPLFQEDQPLSTLVSFVR